MWSQERCQPWHRAATAWAQVSRIMNDHCRVCELEGSFCAIAGLVGHHTSWLDKDALTSKSFAKIVRLKSKILLFSNKLVSKDQSDQTEE